MGKYTNKGKKLTKYVWDDPRGNASRVIDALIEAIGNNISDMKNRYKERVVSAARNPETTRLMEVKLATWLKRVPRIADRFADVMAEAKGLKAPR